MSSPIAGWYDDAQDRTRERWWDGTAWTEHTRTRAPLAPPPPAPVPAPVPGPTATANKQLEHALVPTDRTALSIAAGYLGLLSVLGVFAPAALVVGVLALRDLRRRPEKLGAGRAWFGVVMGGLVCLAIVAAVVTGN